MHKQLIPFAVIISVFLLFSCQAVTSKKADTILYNGVFFTADSLQPLAQAVAIKDGSIIAVGSDDSILLLADASTQKTDLKGAFGMPGLIDGHGHFLSLGNSMRQLNLQYSKNWDTIIQSVQAIATQTPKGSWIVGSGWHQEKWDKPPFQNISGYPLHHDLSKVTEEHPVLLYHASGHALFANAPAMRLAGISPETKSPAGGNIVKDKMGNPSGIFEENAMNLITDIYTKELNAQPESQKQALFEEQVKLASEACLRNGITSFQDAGSTFEEIARLKDAAQKRQLPIRLWAMLLQPTSDNFYKIKQTIAINEGNHHLTVNAIKGYFDGALGSYGAWLLDSYSDKPNFTGQNTTPTDTLIALAKVAKKEGMQFCVHAIGDRANRTVLDIFQQNMQDNKGESLRWRIEHAQHIDSLDIPRFGSLGVIASMQAIHCTSDAPFVQKRLGYDRARTGAYAWRSLLRTGAHLANGTDTPVEEVNPFSCLYASVTRRRADTGFSFFPEQKMTREEALLSYTAWNAFAAKEEQWKGTISVGKLADIVILDNNLLTCPDEAILLTKPLLTMVGGQILFKR